MRSKLTLNLDDLAVDSFDTTRGEKQKVPATRRCLVGGGVDGDESRLGVRGRDPRV